jgi:hypothetical protein
MPKSAGDLAAEMQRIYQRADDARRDLTQDERDHVIELLEGTKSQKAIEDRLRVLGPVTDDFAAGPGDLFVRSAEFKKIAGLRGQQWSSGPVEIPLQAKGTLLEGAGAPGSGSGGGLIPGPQIVPGYVQQLQRPTYLEGLFDFNTASTSTIRYVTQGTATSGAAGVGEAGLKPESTLGYSTIDEPVKQIARPALSRLTRC